MERVDDDGPPARQEGAHSPDRAGLRRVRVDDVRTSLADDAREAPRRERVAYRRQLARQPAAAERPGRPACSATNSIDSSPGATSPATSIVSYPRSASPRARYVTWSAGPPTLSRAITRTTRIGRPSTRFFIAGERNYTRPVAVAKALFWGSLGALAWTHVGYPLAVGTLARVRERRVAKDPSWEPRAAVIVAAHNEEAVIERRLENLLALDYPRDRLEIVVASDASTDRTNELVEAVAGREPPVRLLDCPRGGKVAAQDRAVRETAGEVVAFSDANATWAPDALRKLVASLADPDVAYVCGRLRLEDADGSNREGLYWRYELWLRDQESRLGSVTGGNGSIYALKRDDYIEVDPRWGHDLAFPYRMVQAGRRAVYEPAALAFEKPTPTNEAEYARKVRMFEHCWEITLRGSMLRRLPPGYLVSVISHRVLRYGSGLLHVALLATSVVLAPQGWPYALALLGQLALLAAFAAGVPIARYYVYVTWATVEALWNYLRRGVPATWDAAEGTR